MPRRNRCPRTGALDYGRRGWRPWRYQAPRWTYLQRTAAAEMLPLLRAEVRRQAAATAAESHAILDGADALRVMLPAAHSAQRDYLMRLDPREVARLRSRRWMSTSHADSVDNVAMRLRASLPNLADSSDDEVMQQVWLHHTRVMDAAGAIARGKFPAMHRYGGEVDVRDFAPGVESDGYDVATIMGLDGDAIAHICEVDSVRESDEAYRMLGAATHCELGPAPWLMSAASFDDECRMLTAALSGDEPFNLSECDTLRRLEELVPKLLDDGSDWSTLHARICSVASVAGLTSK